MDIRKALCYKFNTSIRWITQHTEDHIKTKSLNIKRNWEYNENHKNKKKRFPIISNIFNQQNIGDFAFLVEWNNKTKFGYPNHLKQLGSIDSHLIFLLRSKLFGLQYWHILYMSKLQEFEQNNHNQNSHTEYLFLMLSLSHT